MATPAATENLDLPRAMIEVATSASEWVIILPVLLTLLGAAFLLVLHKNRSGQVVFAALVTIAVILCDLELVRRTLEAGPQAMTMGKWLPPFGISFTADAMGAGFALASAVVTLVVILYSHANIAEREVRYGFYPLVLLLLAGVTGAFMTGDLFNLYVWFELMLIASFGLLIMGGRKVQLDGAVKYGFINFLATTFFLIALGYLYGLLGTLNMADIILAVPQAPVGPMTTIAALLLLAFGMKAAAFPVNAWLPASYHTPSAAVSALFGGLLTKVGAYALLRTMIALMPGSLEIMEPLITGIAVVTLVLSPLGALSQTNLRRAIGFLLIGGIGSILTGIAVPSLRGVTGATIYAFSSIITIAALYLVAGLVERMTGENDTRMMGGIYAVSTPLSILFLVLVFALAGMPPFLGFWPKIFLVEASLADGNIALVVALVLNAFLTVIAGSRLWAHIFWRPGREGVNSEQANETLEPLTPRDNYLSMAPTAALVLLIVWLGLQPNGVVNAGRAASAYLLAPQAYIAATGIEEEAR
jgi:multicomponent Na+:H+ antiporter subunit D